MLSQKVSKDSQINDNNSLEEKPSTVVSEQNKVQRRNIYSVIFRNNGKNLKNKIKFSILYHLS